MQTFPPCWRPFSISSMGTHTTCMQSVGSPKGSPPLGSSKVSVAWIIDFDKENSFIFKTYWEQLPEALQYLKPGHPLNTFDSLLLGADFQDCNNFIIWKTLIKTLSLADAIFLYEALLYTYFIQRIFYTRISWQSVEGFALCLIPSDFSFLSCCRLIYNSCLSIMWNSYN